MLIPRIRREGIEEILAVDGGSGDGTRELLTSFGIPVVGQERCGRGEAFRVGMAQSKGSYVTFFSPDGNEDPNDIPKVFSLLESGAQMVIASRFLPSARNEEDGKLLPLRKWGNQLFTQLTNLIWNRHGAPVTDTINGFRGIRREAFLNLKPRSRGYTIELELTIKALRSGMKIQEFPTIENQRIAGRIKSPSWRLGPAFSWFFLCEVWEEMSRRLLGKIQRANA